MKSSLVGILAMVYCGTDQAMRAITWALLLSADLRPYGFSLLALGLLVCLAIAYKGKNESNGLFPTFLFTLGCGYLVPLSVFMYDGRFMKLIFLYRWLEGVLAASLIMGLSKNSCGELRWGEIIILSLLLAVNVLCFAVFWCVEAEARPGVTDSRRLRRLGPQRLGQYDLTLSESNQKAGAHAVSLPSRS